MFYPATCSTQRHVPPEHPDTPTSFNDTSKDTLVRSMPRRTSSTSIYSLVTPSPKYTGGLIQDDLLPPNHQRHAIAIPSQVTLSRHCLPRSSQHTSPFTSNTLKSDSHHRSILNYHSPTGPTMSKLATPSSSILSVNLGKIHHHSK